MLSLEKRRWHRMYFPRIEIINEELGIGACNIEDIPDYLQQEQPKGQITVLYWYERDWLVLNKGNLYYDYYKDFLMNYLQMDNEKRKAVNEFSKTLKMTFFDFVNRTLRIRRSRCKAQLIKTA